jgi:hypothetical protein
MWVIGLYGMAIIANQIIAPNLDVEAAISRNRFLSRLFSWATPSLHTYPVILEKALHNWFWLAMVTKEEIDVDSTCPFRLSTG